jgi:peptide/nickel transport system ATP-binding protein
MSLLSVRNLSVIFRRGAHKVAAVQNLSFDLIRGETLGLLGESGSGKSTAVKALLQLLPPHSVEVTGTALYGEHSLLTLSKKEIQKIRGREIGMIFQDPMTSLNPTLKIGFQIIEGFLHHYPHTSRGAAKEYARELLSLVGLSEPEKRLEEYPHTLSGGMRQRVMIALALASKPQLLIADEPTTALDLTIQAQILDLLKEIQHKQQLTLLLITHDLGVIASLCDRVVILRAGEVVECATIEELFEAPKHPYTQHLLQSLPRFTSTVRSTPQMRHPLVAVKELSKIFPNGLKAVDALSFEIYSGETLGLVGESGCGKSTLGRLLLRLEEPTCGETLFEGKNPFSLSPAELKIFRKRAQMIFQDPYASLNPRMTIGEIVAEPLEIHRLARKEQKREAIVHLLESVRLSPSFSERFPHELSGGERQRVGIARALALAPQFIVCDEPLSSLDASVQMQIVTLLKELQKERMLTYLFISHNLAMVHYLSDRVAVMYLGKIVEIAPTQELYQNPAHPYTKALLSALLPPESKRSRTRIILKGELPRPFHPIQGCPFASRCPLAQEICHHTPPEHKEIAPGHSVACHFQISK